MINIILFKREKTSKNIFDMFVTKEHCNKSIVSFMNIRRESQGKKCHEEVIMDGKCQNNDLY